GCGSSGPQTTTSPVVGGSGDVVVSGSLVRELRNFSDNDPITPAADAHAIISLRKYEGEDVGAPLLMTIDAPFHGFPLAFELRGDAAALFADKGTVLVEAAVYNHADTTAQVGDLVTESRYELRAPARNYVVNVSGLESCKSPNAGGYCL